VDIRERMFDKGEKNNAEQQGKKAMFDEEGSKK
jgi:hypothetical protein